MKLTEQAKMKLEEKYKLVESIYFPDVLYAVDREGKGMRVLYGKSYNQDLPIDAGGMGTYWRCKTWVDQDTYSR